MPPDPIPTNHAYTIKRPPFIGVRNIISFNRHYYILALILIIALFLTALLLNGTYATIVTILAVLILTTILASLAVSAYVYDLSGLYRLEWMDELNIQPNDRVININAGFDETSHLLNKKYALSNLTAFDFYDPERHTERSIRLARKIYPPDPAAQNIDTDQIPLADESVDKAFAIFSAHEIRDQTERINFFRELGRVLKAGGKIVVTEHLRDLPNFLAYNIGFMHFHSRESWVHTFESASFQILKEKKITPFISTFILVRNGNSH